MKRIALLIGSAKSGEPHLPGTRVDVERYAEFLQSPTGGAWDPGEIHSLHDPGPSDFHAAMEATEGCELSFLLFAGHGSLQGGDGGRGSVLLQDGFEVPLEGLATRAAKQLRVVDACRTLVWLPRPHAQARRERWPEPEPDRRALARWQYESVVRAAPPGALAVLFSCAAGEVAGDARYGGVFSSALLDSVRRWSRRSDPRASRVLRPRVACEQAAAMLTGSKPPQHPWIDEAPQDCRLPFAVR